MRKKENEYGEDDADADGVVQIGTKQCFLLILPLKKGTTSLYFKCYTSSVVVVAIFNFQYKLFIDVPQTLFFDCNCFILF